LTCEEYDRLVNPRPDSSEIRMNAPREARRLFPGLNRPRTPRREPGGDASLRHSSGRPHVRLDSTNEELSSRRTIHELPKPCPNCQAQTERAGGCKFMRCKHRRFRFLQHSFANVCRLDRLPMSTELVLGLWESVAAGPSRD
jgi:hypothetical protein